MARITIFICVITFTLPRNVFLFCLRITYTNLKILSIKSQLCRYSCQYNKLGYFVFSNVAKNILGISESVEDAGKILFEIAMNEKFNNVQYLHLSNKLISYKKHKLIITNVSDEAKDPKLAVKLWEFSKELCLCFGMTPINL